jgi:hypothetical protein
MSATARGDPSLDVDVPHASTNPALWRATPRGQGPEIVTSMRDACFKGIDLVSVVSCIHKIWEGQIHGITLTEAETAM